MCGNEQLFCQHDPASRPGHICRAVHSGGEKKTGRSADLPVGFSLPSPPEGGHYSLVKTP
jgi:hypothetical protein